MGKPILLVMVMVLFICGVYIIMAERRHIMMVMLGMEMLAVGLFSMLLLVNYSFNYSFSLVFLTFAVCEAVLGFSLLVGVVRGFGLAKVGGIFSLKF